MLNVLSKNLIGQKCKRCEFKKFTPLYKPYLTKKFNMGQKYIKIYDFRKRFRKYFSTPFLNNFFAVHLRLKFRIFVQN